MIEAVRPRDRREQRRAGRLQRVDSEAREPRVALSALEQQDLPELAHVAQEDLRAAVLEAKPQMGVGVGLEVALRLGREGGALRPRGLRSPSARCALRLRREQPRAGRRAREELPGHAEVHDQTRAVVELRHQVLARAAERRDAAPPEPRAQPRRPCQEEPAVARGPHLADPAADQQRADPPARHLDLGELGHAALPARDWGRRCLAHGAPCRGEKPYSCAGDRPISAG